MQPSSLSLTWRGLWHIDSTCGVLVHGLWLGHSPLCVEEHLCFGLTRCCARQSLWRLTQHSSSCRMSACCRLLYGTGEKCFQHPCGSFCVCQVRWAKKSHCDLETGRCSAGGTGGALCFPGVSWEWLHRLLVFQETTSYLMKTWLPFIGVYLVQNIH